MQTDVRQNNFIIIQMTLAALTFVALGVTVKVLGNRDIDLATVTFSRFLVSLVVYLPAYVKHRPPLWSTHAAGMFWRCLLGLAATAASFEAARTIQLGNATLLTLTSPLFTFLLAPFFIKENISRKQYLWFFTALVGVILLIRVESNSGEIHGVLVGALSGLLAAISYLVIRNLHATETFLSISFTYSLVATIISGIWMFTTTTTFQINGMDYLTLILCGLLATAYQGLYTHALRRATASYLAPLLYSSVVISFFVGWIFFNEPVSTINGIGVVMVIAALIFLGRK